MNLTAARVELANRGFDYLSADRATLFLNRAKNEFEDTWQWPWLETTVTDTGPSVALTTLRSIIYVIDLSNDIALIPAKPENIIDRGGTDISETGAPMYWYLDGTTLNTWPTDAVDLSIRYVMFSPELSADTDEPLIPARNHSEWIDLAVIEAYKDSDNFASSQAVRQDVDRRIAKLIQVYAMRNDYAQQIITGSEDW